MKKLFAITLTVLLLFALTACNSGDESSASGSASSSDDSSIPYKAYSLSVPDESIPEDSNVWFTDSALQELGAQGLAQPEGTEVLAVPQAPGMYMRVIGTMSIEDFQAYCTSAFEVVSANNGGIYSLVLDAVDTMGKIEVSEAEIDEYSGTCVYRVGETPYELKLVRYEEGESEYPAGAVEITFTDTTDQYSDYTFAE